MGNQGDISEYFGDVYVIIYIQSCFQFSNMIKFLFRLLLAIQARIAQLVAYRLGAGEAPGSNPGKGKNFSVKIII